MVDYDYVANNLYYEYLSFSTKYSDKKNLDPEEYRMTLNPYIIKHYLQLVYVHHELKYKIKMMTYTKNYKFAKSFVPSILPTGISDLVMEFLFPLSDQNYNLKQSLHYDLENVFNDNQYATGGLFSYVGDSAINKVNRIKVVGELPDVVGSRRSRIAGRWQFYCKKFLFRTDLFSKTYGFERGDGFYDLPYVFTKIMDKPDYPYW